MLLRGRGIDRDYEARDAGAGVLADPLRFEQSAIAHQHDLDALAGGMTNDVGKVVMQRRLAAGQDEIADALTEQNVDGVECALAIDIFPAFLRQRVAREIAEPAIGIAGIVQRNLTPPGSPGRCHEPQRIPDARTRWRVRNSNLGHFGLTTVTASLPRAILAQAARLRRAKRTGPLPTG